MIIEIGVCAICGIVVTELSEYEYAESDSGIVLAHKNCIDLFFDRM
jgi:hypothetical protein